MTTYAIDQDALFEQINYKPHGESQWAAHNSTARFRIPCCGRRWGKTTFSGVELVKGMFIPDTYYWIVGPNYKLGEKEFRVVHRMMKEKLKLGNKIKATYNPKQGDMSIRTDWNSTLEVVSAERKESLLGEGLDGAVMAEAARHTMDIWEQYIQPALSDRRGWAIFPSTPRGYNWYHGLWKLGQNNIHPDYESWRFPSWTNLVSFPEGRNDPEIIRMETVTSKQYFKQEIAAEFTAFEGKIYEEWSEDIHVKRIDYNPAWKNFLAFDFGWAVPFVCLDIMVDAWDNVYVWREYQVRHVNSYEHAAVLKNRRSPDGYHIDGMFGDPRGADQASILEAFLGPISRNAVPWILGIEAVKRWLKLQEDGKPKLYVDASCVHLIRQMDQLRAPEQTNTSKEPKEGQHDVDDHGPDALRYFFSEYYVLGANSHLTDLYPPGYSGSESESFFKLGAGFTLGNNPFRDIL